MPSRPSSEGGIFAPVSSRAGERRKYKTSVKTVYRIAKRFYHLSVSLYTRASKRFTTAHRTPHKAQSNPGPLRKEQAGVLSFVPGDG